MCLYAMFLLSPSPPTTTATLAAELYVSIDRQWRYHESEADKQTNKTNEKKCKNKTGSDNQQQEQQQRKFLSFTL